MFSFTGKTPLPPEQVVVVDGVIPSLRGFSQCRLPKSTANSVVMDVGLVLPAVSVLRLGFLV